MAIPSSRRVKFIALQPPDRGDIRTHRSLREMVKYYRAGMSSSGPWWASPLIALVGPVVGVVLTLYVTGRRDTRSRFGDEKRTVYADFLIACARLRDAAVWPPASEAGEDIGALLRQIRGTAMHTVLTAHRDVGQLLTGVLAAAQQLAAVIDDIRQSSKPGYRGATDERQRGRHEAAVTALSTALNSFTKAARLDLNVRTPMTDPFPLAGAET